MTQEEQIREMACDSCSNTCKGQINISLAKCEELAEFHNYTIVCVDYMVAARRLLAAGYRKINKGDIYWTREQLSASDPAKGYYEE